MSIDHRADYSFPPHVLVREIEGQLVLLDVQAEQYYGLDEIGAEIISGVTSMTLDDVLASVAEHYDVEPSELRIDATELIEELLEAGLLRAVDA